MRTITIAEVQFILEGEIISMPDILLVSHWRIQEVRQQRPFAFHRVSESLVKMYRWRSA